MWNSSLNYPCSIFLIKSIFQIQFTQFKISQPYSCVCITFLCFTCFMFFNSWNSATVCCELFTSTMFPFVAFLLQKSISFFLTQLHAQKRLQKTPILGVSWTQKFHNKFSVRPPQTTSTPTCSTPPAKCKKLENPNEKCKSRSYSHFNIFKCPPE